MAHYWVLSAFVLLVGWSAPIASAQEEILPLQVDPYIAVFGGVTLPAQTDTKVESGSLNQHVTVLDQNFGSSRSIGGKVGVWVPALRRSTGLDYGLELDVTNYQPNLKAGRFRASGTVSGVPIIGANMSSSLDVNSTIVAANFLLRLPLYV